MSKKSRERRKAQLEGKDQPDAKPSTTAEALRRRRNRRLILVAVIGLAFPILELIAYRYRVITITVFNRSDQVVTKVSVTYPGGSFNADELKPSGSITRGIRPNYSFKGSSFGTYFLEVRFSTDDGGIIRQVGPTGSIDFSATETFTIEPDPLAPRPGSLKMKHTTAPGFPLSLIRDLLGKLGMG